MFKVCSYNAECLTSDVNHILSRNALHKLDDSSRTFPWTCKRLRRRKIQDSCRALLARFEAVLERM